MPRRLPAFEESPFDSTRTRRDLWINIDSGVYEIGHSGNGFGFDNESPRHPVFLPDSQVSRDLVTCGEYLEFMNDGCYERPEHWLSAGWTTVQRQYWDAPLYWVKQNDQWMQFTLAGLVPVDPDWPVCHVSYFEADAFARWRGARLPTEFEWEVACGLSEGLSKNTEKDVINKGQFADQLLRDGLCIHPTSPSRSFTGSVWQWTASSYEAYPGLETAAGALGEYNGKFMCNQYVLRGGSVATSSSHIRPTNRNFFPAHTRWQFSGIRLAKTN